jgi:hypothetical protein
VGYEDLDLDFDSGLELYSESDCSGHVQVEDEPRGVQVTFHTLILSPKVFGIIPAGQKQKLIHNQKEQTKKKTTQVTLS